MCRAFFVCQTDILLSALPALYQIDQTLCLAGSRFEHLVGFFSDSASECVRGFDVSAGLTASAVTWPGSIFPGAFSHEDKFINTCLNCF